MRTEQFDLTYCYQLYRKGLTDQEMAKELSTRPRNIQHWRLKRRLKHNKPKLTLEEAILQVNGQIREWLEELKMRRGTNGN